ncbi:MAG: hypothetical protein SCK29_11040 [Bacillota bacterium]|nr:hypothetical protein [Bacillota bacterium]MDW7684639.1 hypothetical protein [Bacillota bacterium]
MKKWLPFVVLTLVLTLALAGVAAAAVTEEPLVLEEGEVGITSVPDEPVEHVAEEGEEGEPADNFVEEPTLDVVGEGIEGEVTITGTNEEIYASGPSLGDGIDNLKPGATEQTNYVPYVAGGGVLLLALAFVSLRKKTAHAK